MTCYQHQVITTINSGLMLEGEQEDILIERQHRKSQLLIILMTQRASSIALYNQNDIVHLYQCAKKAGYQNL